MDKPKRQIEAMTAEMVEKIERQFECIYEENKCPNCSAALTIGNCDTYRINVHPKTGIVTCPECAPFTELLKNP